MPRFIRLLALLALPLSALAQTGHPAKGSWAGFLDPVGSDLPDQRIRLLIDDHDGELSAVVNPGRRGVDASRVELDAPSWTLILVAQTPEGALELNGTLENLGSWSNRRYHGTYTLGDREGTFSVTRN